MICSTLSTHISFGGGSDTQIRKIKSSLGVLLWLNRLRIPFGHYCGAGSVPDPETSVCCGLGKKEKEKEGEKGGP